MFHPLSFLIGWWPSIPEFKIVLVEPKYSGNIGAVARVMMNFDVHQLILVNPCELDDICYIRSVHADSVLDEAIITDSFENAVENIDFLISTSSIPTLSDKKHLRHPVYLDEITEKIAGVEGTIGLVFGREDYGLYNHEIAACDLMMKIPTSDAYSSLNLSHAVAVVLYRIYMSRTKEKKSERSLDHVEKNHLFEAFSQLLDSINYPAHKREKTLVMFKRMMGRSLPSKWEYHTLMGVIRTAAEKSNEKK